MDQPELRQDIVTGDWVLIAPKRSKRSKKKLVRSSGRRSISLSSCPLENLVAASGGALPLLQYGEGKKWRVGVIENKFPAVSHRDTCPMPVPRGIYQHREAVGRHELLITRSHTKNISDMTAEQGVEIFNAFIERSRVLAEDSCLEYASIFQNYGLLAGGSQTHPHFQIIAVPIIPPSIAHSMAGASAYYREHKRCAHCAVIAYEQDVKERIIFENEHALVVAPYASVDAFEFHIYPKKHVARLADTAPEALAGVVRALQIGLRSLKKALHDPDYNLFLHTAALKKDGGDGEYYHWHIEVFPKSNDLAGFELSTGMVINPVAPEAVAELLRKSV
jgi:UDPglucose--hexose-1-phosphate uridylyltransferase